MGQLEDCWKIKENETRVSLFKFGRVASKTAHLHGIECFTVMKADERQIDATVWHFYFF